MGVTIETPAAYRAAAALLGEAIVGLADTEWDLECGPDGLKINEAVAWVVVGDSQISSAIDRGRLDRIGEIEANVLGPNLVATWRGTALAAITSLDARGALDDLVEHPDGRLAVTDLVWQRITENLVRAFDIGRAVGRDVDIPHDLAEQCLEFWNTHAEAVMRGGVFPSAPVEPPPDAEAPTRFLAFTGRRV